MMHEHQHRDAKGKRQKSACVVGVGTGMKAERRCEGMLARRAASFGIGAQ
jgi:hypothetical protein